MKSPIESRQDTSTPYAAGAGRLGLEVVLANNCVHNLLSLLRAISDNVLVVAPDVDDAQRCEIARELAVMRLLARQCQEVLALPDVPGSFHLQRAGADSHA